MTLLFAIAFGFVQGLRHALEPDHVVAVSTMLAQGRGARARMVYAVAWGVGHAATLVCFGSVLMLARADVSERLDRVFEVVVSLMLIGLGCRALWLAARTVRLGMADSPAHAHSPARGLGALAMGVIHGLAGSGALTAFVVARMPSIPTGVLVMVVFGAGATLGMALLAGALGIPLARILRTYWGAAATIAISGGISLALGMVWIVQAARAI